jgi:hypothetical protein
MQLISAPRTRHGSYLGLPASDACYSLWALAMQTSCTCEVVKSVLRSGREGATNWLVLGHREELSFILPKRVLLVF